MFRPYFIENWVCFIETAEMGIT